MEAEIERWRTYSTSHATPTRGSDPPVLIFDDHNALKSSQDGNLHIPFEHYSSRTHSPSVTENLKPLKIFTITWNLQGKVDKEEKTNQTVCTKKNIETMLALY